MPGVGATRAPAVTAGDFEGFDLATGCKRLGFVRFASKNHCHLDALQMA
jgi:hypothetical protein